MCIGFKNQRLFHVKAMLNPAEIHYRLPVLIRRSGGTEVDGGEGMGAEGDRWLWDCTDRKSGPLALSLLSHIEASPPHMS